MKKSANTGSNVLALILLGLLMVIWHLIAEYSRIQKFLPSPAEVVNTLVEVMPLLKIHIWTTLKEAMIGFFISIILAVVIAVFMDNIKLVKKAVYPLLIVSQTIPIIALAPLFMLWFGFGMLPKIIVVVLVCFFPVVISLFAGLSSVDEDMVNLLKSMGANKLQIIGNAKIPASLPFFFAGLKITATYSIMGAVIGEWLGGDKGLGVYMMRVRHSYSYDKVFAAVMVIVLLSMVLFKIISVIQTLSMPWQRKNTEV